MFVNKHYIMSHLQGAYLNIIMDHKGSWNFHESDFLCEDNYNVVYFG